MQSVKINIPLGAKLIIEKLNKAGYKAYAVGGCVRDSLLMKKPEDWDITTSASPEKVVELFSPNVILTGLKHGTVTVRHDGKSYEVTTFRSDGKYNDSRHPEKVEFVSCLEEDLKRRDFTVNAMAYSEESGLIDLYGGLADLKNGVLRAVGEPMERFEEDALRILRGVRFVSSTGFSIEENTLNAMKKRKDLLKNVSVERIFVELEKTLLGEFVDKALLDAPEIIFTIIPEMEKCYGFLQHSKWHLHDVYTHTVIAVKSVRADRALRWCMLLHDIAKPDKFFLDDKGEGHFYGHPEQSFEMAKVILKRLKTPTKLSEEVLILIKNHDVYLPTESKKIKRNLRKFGEEIFLKLLEVKFADNQGQGTQLALAENKKLTQIKEIIENVVKSGECYNLKTLAVNGEDLISLGYKGKEIGKVLDDLLDDVINGNLPNEKQRLLKSLKKRKIGL
ncbi:MAG: CCA tRNA nucleotidyltransferase [Clostridia bacterium]|nr:CCA tRNA nucleotidyltransferase [Clostridia bacterium]